MKFYKIVFVLAIAITTMISCKSETKTATTQTKEIAKADTKELAINISGMTCEIGCAKVIQSKLSKHDGVLDAKVIFKDSLATVKYDATKTNKASLISFVDGIAGNMYKASEATTKACTKSEKACCSEKKEKACASTKDAKACSSAAKKECGANKA